MKRDAGLIHGNHRALQDGRKKHSVPRPAAGYIKYKPWVSYAGPAGFTADAADGCSAGGTGVVRHDALQVNLSKALRRRW